MSGAEYRQVARMARDLIADLADLTNLTVPALDARIGNLEAIMGHPAVATLEPADLVGLRDCHHRLHHARRRALLDGAVSVLVIGPGR